jgi:predicted aspartyl protease
MAQPLIGSFNNSGSPVIKIIVYGVFDQAKREFDAIVDTGFTGFLSMPLVQAFPLGLILIGTTSVVLADGSSSEKLMALGRITLGDRTETGIVLLGGNQSDVLVGMQFLRTFQRTFFLTEARFFLIDNEEIKKAMQQTYQQMSSQLPAPSEAGDEPSSQP